ncbi:MAG TPA: heme oxygenase, partial [Pseudomonas sp.]|nr:heme oxygenase [Pseudomonas sp.]
DAARCAWEPMLAAAETTFAMFAEAATQERACEPG